MNLKVRPKLAKIHERSQKELFNEKVECDFDWKSSNLNNITGLTNLLILNNRKLSNQLSVNLFEY